MPKLEKRNGIQVTPIQPDLMYFPLGYGGKRSGAGRPSTVKSAVVRVPADLLHLIDEMKQAYTNGLSIRLTIGGEV